MTCIYAFPTNTKLTKRQGLQIVDKYFVAWSKKKEYNIAYIYKRSERFEIYKNNQNTHLRLKLYGDRTPEVSLAAHPRQSSVEVSEVIVGY